MTSVLKVDNIQNSSGTDAISIDSSGRVTQPKIAHVRAGATNDAYVAHTANLPFKLNTVISGDASMYDTSTYKFTIPVSGVYMLTSNVLVDGVTTSHMDIYVNDVHRFRGGSSVTSERMFSVCVAEELSANDVVFFAPHISDSFYMDGTHSWATVTLIG